jgi:hypothetical protein
MEVRPGQASPGTLDFWRMRGSVRRPQKALPSGKSRGQARKQALSLLAEPDKREVRWIHTPKVQNA